MEGVCKGTRAAVERDGGRYEEAVIVVGVDLGNHTDGVEGIEGVCSVGHSDDCRGIARCTGRFHRGHAESTNVRAEFLGGGFVVVEVDPESVVGEPRSGHDSALENVLLKRTAGDVVPTVFHRPDTNELVVGVEVQVEIVLLRVAHPAVSSEDVFVEIVLARPTHRSHRRLRKVVGTEVRNDCRRIARIVDRLGFGNRRRAVPAMDQPNRRFEALKCLGSFLWARARCGEIGREHSLIHAPEVILLRLEGGCVELRGRKLARVQRRIHSRSVHGLRVEQGVEVPGHEGGVEIRAAGRDVRENAGCPTYGIDRPEVPNKIDVAIVASCADAWEETFSASIEVLAECSDHLAAR